MKSLVSLVLLVTLIVPATVGTTACRVAAEDSGTRQYVLVVDGMT